MCYKNMIKKMVGYIVVGIVFFARTDQAKGTNVVVTVLGHGLSESLYAVSEFYQASVNLEDPACFIDKTLCHERIPGRNSWSYTSYVFRFSFSSTGTVFDAIESAMAANKLVDPAVVTYNIITNESCPNVFTVLPTHWEKGVGAQKGFASLLATKLTIGPGEGSFIKRFCAALKAASPYDDDVVPMLSRPFPESLKEAESSASSNETAMIVLNKLYCNPLDRTDEHKWNGGESWRLFRGPISSIGRVALLSNRPLNYHYPTNACKMDRFVSSHNFRPMANTIHVVSQDIRHPIGYEDPCGPVFIRDVNMKPYATQEAFVHLCYSSSWNKRLILDTMLKKFRYEDCNFRIAEENSFFCVLPNQQYKRQHNSYMEYTEEYHPISTNTVELVADNTNAYAIITEICRQLGKASGRKIVLSKDAKEILLAKRASCKSQGVPGWLALSKYLKDISESLNWRLLYKPATDKHVLDIYDWTKPVFIMGGDPTQPAEEEMVAGSMNGL